MSGTPEAPRPHNGALFAGLFALFVVLHHWKQLPLDESFEISVLRALMCGVACWVWLVPDRLMPLMVLSGLVVLGVGVQLPWMSNSWMLAGCLAVAVAVPAARGWANGERTVSACWESMRSGVGWSLIVFYGFASLAKLNRDFIDPEVSCAGALLDGMAQTLPLPTGLLANQVAIGATVGFEFGIPVLFLFRRTRSLGIVLGLFFHALIASAPHVHIFDFSLLMFVGYTALAPPDLLQRFGVDPGLRIWRLLGERRAMVLAGIAVMAGASAMGALTGSGWTQVQFVRALVWNLIAVVLVSGGVLALWSTGPAARLRSPGVGGAIAIALVVLNGASPYLGLKTTVCFTMFSNLKTEQGLENSLVVPAAARVFSYQDDLLEVLASNTERVPSDPALRFPEAYLRERLAGHPEAQLRVRSSTGEQKMSGGEPLPPLERFLSFRPVDTGRTCQW